MKIELKGQSLRVSNYQDKTYVDVREAEGYTHYSHQVNFYPDYHYCVLAELKGCMSVIIFENEEWFNDWRSDEGKDVKIVEVFTKTKKENSQ